LTELGLGNHIKRDKRMRDIEARERAAQAVRLGARLDDVGAIGDAIQQGLAEAGE
jgi:hypothetical protein